MGQAISNQRINSYAVALADLKQERLDYAFEQALKRSKTFPQVSQLLEFANEWRPPEPVQPNIPPGAKPPDWIPLDELKKEIEERRRLQEIADLAYVETDTDASWPKLHQTNPGTRDEWYTSYVRRKEARERQKAASPPVAPDAIPSAELTPEDFLKRELTRLAKLKSMPEVAPGDSK